MSKQGIDIIRIAVVDLAKADFFRTLKEGVDKEDGFSALAQVESQESFAGMDPAPGQIEDGNGICDQNLGEPLLFKFLHNAMASLFI